MNRKKRLVPWIVAAMLLALLPMSFVSAQQTEKMDLTLLTEDADGLGWEWSVASKTLVLNGLDMDTSGIDDTDPILHLPADSTIVLADGSDNRIRSNSTRESGIRSQGDLEIVGDGHLEIDGVGTHAIYVAGDLSVRDVASLVITSPSTSPQWLESIEAEGRIHIENVSLISAVSHEQGMTAKEDLHVENVTRLEISLEETEVSESALSAPRITIKNCQVIDLRSLGISGRGIYSFATDDSAFILIENCDSLSIEASIGILSSGSITLKDSSVTIDSLEYALAVNANFGGDYVRYGGDIEIIRSYAWLDSHPDEGAAILTTSDWQRFKIILTDSIIVEPEEAYIVNAIAVERWMGQSVTGQSDLEESTHPSELLNFLKIEPIVTEEVTPVNGTEEGTQNEEAISNGDPEGDDASQATESSEATPSDGDKEATDVPKTDAPDASIVTIERESIPETGDRTLRVALPIVLTLLLLFASTFVLVPRRPKKSGR